MHVVVEVGAQDTPEMPFVENDDMIKILATDRPDESLNIRVLPKGSRRDEHILDAHVPDVGTKHVTVDCIAFMNQEARCSVEWKSFDDLLGRPLGHRMGSDVEVHDLSPVVARTTNVKRIRNVVVGTVKKSMARMSLMWLSRKAGHV